MTICISTLTTLLGYFGCKHFICTSSVTAPLFRSNVCDSGCFQCGVNGISRTLTHEEGGKFRCSKQCDEQNGIK
jgi:hypothetical protein